MCGLRCSIRDLTIAISINHVTNTSIVLLFSDVSVSCTVFSSRMLVELDWLSTICALLSVSEKPDGISVSWIFRKDGKSSTDFWLIYDRFERRETVQSRAILRGGFNGPLGRLKGHLAVDGGVRRVFLGIFPLRFSYGFSRNRQSFIIGSSTAGRAMQQEHRKSNQTTQP